MKNAKPSSVALRIGRMIDHSYLLCPISLLTILACLTMAMVVPTAHGQDGTYSVRESWSVSVNNPEVKGKPAVFTRTGVATGTVTISGGAYELINKTGVAKVGSLNASINSDSDPYTINAEPVLYAFAAKGAEFYAVVKLNFFVVLVPLESDWGFSLFQEDDQYTGTFVSATEVEGFGAAVDGNNAQYNVSSVATLTAAAPPHAGPPKITAQPQKQEVIAGGQANFSVTATSTTPLSYQWRLNGVDLTDGDNLNGSTNSGLAIYSAEAGDAGKYTVIVSNAKGSVTSAAAELTLETPPIILTDPEDKAVIAGQNAVFTVTASGSAPLTYRWQLDGYDLSNGHGVSGATTARLTVHASADNAGEYSVTVNNAVGSAESDSAELTVAFRPVITSRPVSQTVAVGGSASFSIEATGTEPLTYQWKRHGIDLSDDNTYTGTATPNLFINNVQTDKAGAYNVVVANIVGSTASPSATLRVDIPPAVTIQPTNQTVAADATATFIVKATGTAPLRYQWQMNGTDLSNGAGVSGVATDKLTLRKVQADSAGTYTVIITNIVGTAVSSNAVLTIPGSSTNDLARKSVLGGEKKLPSANASRPVITGAQFLPNGAFQISIAGDSAQNVIIQTSTTLSPDSWVNLTTNAVVNGQLIFTHSNALQNNCRFYRAVSQP
jgi:hypothetical protein